MNDNQYICHSSEIICHAGKKGMKWGQGPYSKLKGYVKKIDDATLGIGLDIEHKKLVDEFERNWLNQQSEQFLRPSNIIKDKDRVFPNKWHPSTDAINAQRSAARIQGLKNEEHALRAKLHSNRKKKDRSLFGKAKLIFGKPRYLMFANSHGNSAPIRRN